MSSACSFQCNGSTQPACDSNLLKNAHCSVKNNKIICPVPCADMRRMCRSRGGVVKRGNTLPIELVTEYDESMGFLVYNKIVNEKVKSSRDEDGYNPTRRLCFQVQGNIQP